jgi:hypothetical protein
MFSQYDDTIEVNHLDTRDLILNKKFGLKCRIFKLFCRDKVFDASRKLAKEFNKPLEEAEKEFY